jgi:hypothetical protein
MAKCWKVPLLRHGQGVTRQGDHEISVPPATNCDVALAHFKFLERFERKIAAAVDDAQYFGQSVEYRLLEAAIAMAGNRSLLGPESLQLASDCMLIHGTAGSRLTPLRCPWPSHRPSIA